ncbi:Na+/H+ antiporter subunit D [Rhabdothermincola salaria]|uniref:Na+/H+ antiporter subunit D n=1 Tax=Rhabdothermincola salaria TaxID=2903142 RepID=UPI001E41948E|nr:Na+/H+ antiporter subunit D [Rhabdothermincola salaria]
MRFLLPATVAIPLVFAALAVVAARSRTAQRVLSLVGVTASLVVAIVVLVLVERDGIASVTLGGWPAPVGISLVADLFASMMLVVGLVTILAVLVYSIGQRGTDDLSAFHPVYLTLTAGIALSFLTGDLFNLFVAFEITLTSSYVLITLGGRRAQVRHGMTYVVVNLLASMLFLTGVGLIYAATGTVNMADLAEKVPELPGGLQTALGLLFLVVFGIKAAIFPLFNWLPDSYPTARVAVTAVFAGLLTKVGVYAVIRTQTLMFPEREPSTLLLVVAGLTMIVGVLGAIAQNDMKRILSFHIVSQIGYMVLGLGLFTVAGLAGAVLFLVHQIPVKTSLFLASGLVEQGAGSTALDRVGGLLRRSPLVAGLFALAALSLAGIPPFSGFVGKLALIDAGFDAGQYTIVAVSLVGSLLTLFSMAKIWNGVFWGQAEHPTELVAHGPARLRSPWVMNGATIALVGVTLAIAVFAGPIYHLCERAAETLIDPSGYISAVMGR